MPTLTRPRRTVSDGSPRTPKSAAPTAAEIVVFSSDLGWMAALVRRAEGSDVLWELTFGHSSPQRAVAGLVSAAAAGAATAQREPLLVRKLQAFARGERVDLNSIVIDQSGDPPFARRVVELCRSIPYGKTQTYSELAALAGSPRAARAVGNVMRTNRCPLVVPCHRVVPRGAGLGGYSAQGGVRTKLRLLELERGR